MSQAKRDQNRIPAIQGVSSIDYSTPTDIWVNPTTHALLIDSTSLYTGLDSRYLKLDGTNSPMTGDLILYDNTVHVKDYTLTVPATMTAAGLGIANLFTADQKINVNSTTGLVVEQSGVNDNVFVVDTTNGRIALGIANPAHMVHFYKAVGGATQYYSSGSSSAAIFLAAITYSAVVFVKNGANSGNRWCFGMNFPSGTNQDLKFYNYTSARVELCLENSTGNIGIGNISPAGKVHISGVADNEQLIVQANSTQTANILEIQKSDGTVLFEINNFGKLTINNSYGATTPGFGINLSASATTATELYGMNFGLQRTGAGGTWTIGIVGQISLSASTVNAVNSIGYASQFRIYVAGTATYTSTVGTARAINIPDISTNAYSIVTNSRGINIGNTGGTGVVNAHGLYIDSQSGASTLNYAIYTNAGLNRLGDQLSIVGSADRIQTIIKANSTQTANILEIQKSDGTLLTKINGLGKFATNPTMAYSDSELVNAVDIGRRMLDLTTAGSTGKRALNVDVQFYNNTNSSADYVGASYLVRSSAGNTTNFNSLSAQYNQVTHVSNGNGANLIGNYTDINLQNAGTATLVYGTYSSIRFLGTGGATNAYCFRAFASKSSSGAPTNMYGLYVNDINIGATLNYAIYTNAGIIHAGDKLEFTQTDGNEYIDSLNDGYMDYGATTAHRFNTPVRASTAIYRRYYHLPLASFNPGASGATWTAQGANNLNGWQLNAATEMLEFDADIHSDWDGASDLMVEVYFQLLTAGSAGDTVDLKLVCRYMGNGDVATKTQTIEVATVTDGTQYKMYKAEFVINYDEVSNVVDAGDLIDMELNLETDTSEIDNILITSGTFYYNTTHTGIEQNDV